MTDVDSAVKLIEDRIGYCFKDKNFIKEALTHSSFANERKINKLSCNERLEYLGDAVLELVSSDHIFRNYPSMPEGRMSKFRASLVCEEALAQCAERIGLGTLIFLGKGEEQSGGREKPSVTSDAFEALIGALYMDGGLDTARNFIMEHVLKNAEEHLVTADPKSALQEKVQGMGHETIEYRVVSETGPEHDKSYSVELLIGGKVSGSGTGRSKKLAEKEAALEALRRL
ncbi:MAG: ribonuclease III [Lachnospiraceae bacterium]|nr:ribonuclease III [Lachnospiraceae bacterium]